MTPSDAALNRTVPTSALWLRSLIINAVALIAAHLLLGGFEIHGAFAYVASAIGIELPTMLWLLVSRVWRATAFDNISVLDSWAGRWAWISVSLGLTLVAPLLLATSLPGLLVAEWIGPLRIQGVWTYLAACAITSVLTIGLRQSRPLRFVRAFLAGPDGRGFSRPTTGAPSD